MASTVLVRHALFRASVLLEDSSPQFTAWTQRELLDWLNDACVAIAKFLPSSCSRIDAVQLAPGTRQSIERIAALACKPGDGSTPSQDILGTALLDVIRNLGPDGKTPGRVIRQIAREIMDSQSPAWHQTNGSAVKSFMYDPRTPRYFYVTPGVLGTQWVELAYYAQPLAIHLPQGAPADYFANEATASGTLAAELLPVADEFLDDVVNYIVARANSKDAKWADANKATAFTNLFTGSLNAKVAAITGNSPGITALPLAR